MNFKLSDFTVGEKAYIELTGNASRYKKEDTEECIVECTVESIGKKYVTANGVKFEEHDCCYGGLKEHTNYCVDYVLYPDKQAILDKFEKENLLTSIRHKFSGYSKMDYTLDQLRRIQSIIDEVGE